MIVTCPACSSRYKFDDARLNGKSAKITCPSCQHVFVVHPPRIDPVTQTDTWPPSGPDVSPAEITLQETDRHIDIETVDFSTYGIVWRVRQGMITHDFLGLSDIREALDEGAIDTSDELSHDGRLWLTIDTIDAVEARMQDVLKRVEAGEMFTAQANPHLIIGGDDGDEDAPTMIVRASSLGLEFDMDEDEAPPPAASAFDGSSDDPETETEPEPPVTPPEGMKTATPPTPAAKTTESGRSILPIVFLVLVILSVVGLILYSQGMLDGIVG